MLIAQENNLNVLCAFKLVHLYRVQLQYTSFNFSALDISPA